MVVVAAFNGMEDKKSQFDALSEILVCKQTKTFDNVSIHNEIPLMAFITKRVFIIPLFIVVNSIIVIIYAWNRETNENESYELGFISFIHKIKETNHHHGNHKQKIFNNVQKF